MVREAHKQTPDQHQSAEGGGTPPAPPAGMDSPFERRLDRDREWFDVEDVLHTDEQRNDGEKQHGTCARAENHSNQHTLLKQTDGADRKQCR